MRAHFGILGAVIAGVSLIMFTGCGTVPAGHRGVWLSWGAAQPQELGEGTHWLWFGSSIVPMSIQIQKNQVETEASSRDLQLVHVEIALNYRLMEKGVVKMYQDVGTDYVSSIIDPALKESAKSAISHFTAEELITKREECREKLRELIEKKLTGHTVSVEALSIVDLDFSKSFNEAIEAKVTAEQNALAAKNKLQQVQFEAEQEIAKAKGKAEAMKVEAAALASTPQIMQLRALEKWDGVLPRVTGSGGVPFIQLEMAGK